MKRFCLTILTITLGLALNLPLAAQDKPQKPAEQKQQTGAQPKAPATPTQIPTIDRKKVPLADRPNLSLADVNTFIAVDRRIIVVMAALNIAGYDYEFGSRPLSVLRQQVREDFKNLNPDLVGRLRQHFAAHRNGKNDAASVAPYLSLALTLTDPPAFTIDIPAERLPDDVRQITDFALLLEEFYRESSFSRLMPKYVDAYVKAAQTYPQAAGVALGTVLAYLHTEPVLELPPLFVPRRSAPSVKADKKSGEKQSKSEKPKEEVVEDEVPNRVRQYVILPDLLNSTGSANLRVIRDTYFLLLGPTTEPNIEAIRRGFLTFVIDPLTERQIKEVAAMRAQLKKLMETRGDRLDREYAQRSAYYLLSDSLVRAIDARMDVLGLATRKAISEDEGIYQLSLAYDRGAVLVYHFYDQLKISEAAGVNIRDYLSGLLQNIDFDRESRRLDEYAQRLARYKQIRTEATLQPAPAPTISNADDRLVSRIVEADRLIKTRQYADAKVILDTALKERPDNARVLFGLAEVASKQASTIDDADRVEELLYAAVEYYRQAAKNSSPETEKWLAQRSYVAAGKILDFIAESNPSVAEKMTAEATMAYDMAIKLGKVEGGAFEEAEKAVKSRGQKNKQ